ncbi:hypothetical protein [Ureibacillus sinduriensis]|uniref:Uncharacterized protein n=1 Tax=Ureibacillus sinduriensis BLB-1 = JCM 15800 TaxID=1384057 RepID=A0A0A3HUH9_9BACL|nr:hypothetical protein [Ureibacillus sinduriensis]KGR76109.1 hypothetical protein CD33_07995 [Ureibacillus sinduriensis BLB-1 = JCM 15800]
MDNPIYFSPMANNLYRLSDDSQIEANNQSYFASDRLGEFMLSTQEQHEQLLEQHDHMIEQLECLNECLQQNSLQQQFQQGRLNSSLDMLSNGYHSLEKKITHEVQHVNMKMDSLTEAQRLQRSLMMNSQSMLLDLGTLPGQMTTLSSQLQELRSLPNQIEELRTLPSQVKELGNLPNQIKELKTLPDQVKRAQDSLLSSQKLLQSQLMEQLNKLTDALQSNQGDLQNSLEDLESGLLEELNEHREGTYNSILDTINQLKVLIEKQSPYDYFQFGDRITIIDRNGNTLTGVYIENTEDDIIWVNDATMRLSFTNTKGMTISKT